MACCLPMMKPFIFQSKPPLPKGCGCCCAVPTNCILDCMMHTCCATSLSGGMQSPCLAKMMQPLMRYMMDGLMKVTDHDNDPTYKEVQDVRS